MADCKTCKRTDVKCCPTCGRGNDCDVYHKCGEDCIGFKPMTQADRIRSMTDEELVEFLCNYDACLMCKYSSGGCSIINCDEIGITENWLKSEVGCE